jgi:hypothetical protein
VVVSPPYNRESHMPWEITQLSPDFKTNRALVTLQNQIPPNQSLTATVTFPIGEADQQQEGTLERRLKQRAKHVLLEAANSL